MRMHFHNHFILFVWILMNLSKTTEFENIFLLKLEVMFQPESANKQWGWRWKFGKSAQMFLCYFH